MKRIMMILPSFEARGGIASVVRGYRGSELEQTYDIRYIETYCDGGKTAKLCKALGAYLRFIRELIVFRPDILHVHASFGASFYRKLPFLWAGKLLKIPVINHIHGSEIDRFYRNAAPWEKKLKKSAFQSCTAVIALTDFWKKCFEDTWQLQNVSVVRNYGKLMPRSENRKENTVLFLGFLSQLKGCMDIPRIASLVKRKVPEVKFVLAGSGNAADVQQIRELAVQYGVQDDLVFPGWITGEEKEGMLQEATLFFLPSYTEAMPMSVLEAMGCGLSVVSSHVGGIPQLVEHGKNGFLCQPGDAEAFAAAIVQLLENPELRENMGAAGREFVKAEYSLQKHIDCVSQIYESLF